VTTYVSNGTIDADGAKERVVEEVSDHEPPTAGLIVGIGLPADRGSLRFKVIGPAGETPTWPCVGELDEIDSVWVCSPVVVLFRVVPPVVVAFVV
jgi:hypothetical protein